MAYSGALGYESKIKQAVELVEQGWEFYIIPDLKIEQIKDRASWCAERFGAGYSIDNLGEWYSVPLTNRSGLIDNVAWGFRDKRNLTLFMMRWKNVC